MTKCFYCLDQDLDEFDAQVNDNWYNSVGYCEICGKWYDIKMCDNCKHETIDEITDKEIITDLENDYND